MTLAWLLLAPTGAWAEPDGQLMRFTLPASNGYTLQVETEGTLTHISVWRGSREDATTYDVSDSVEGNEIEADLGALGRIEGRFEPSGAWRTVRVGGSHCRLPRQLGIFNGTISFRGENDYASVDTTSAAGMSGPSPRSGCRGATIGSAHSPPLERRAVERVWAVGDAAMISRTSTASSSTLLVVYREGRATHCFVSRVEVVEPRLAIFRRAVITGSRSIFSYTHTLRSATLAPPAPFSGEATYSARRHRLIGSLAVQFPGLPPQSLAGTGFETKIVQRH